MVLNLKKSYTYFVPRTNIWITNETDYLDGFQYNGGGQLQFVPTANGYYDFAYNRYVYQYKGQVGNIRLSYYHDGNKTVIDKEANYYPFGMEYWGGNGTYPVNRSYTYGFQEQERQEETGWNSFKWRNYDPTLGRFFNVDSLSEVYAYQSHYNFSENRVIDAREIEGLEAKEVNDTGYVGGLYEGGINANGGTSTLMKDGNRNTIGADIATINLGTFSAQSNQNNSSNFSWGDAGRIGVGFIPVVGSGLDIYEGARDGNWVQFGIGVGGLALDVATLGAGSILKGGVKTIGTELVEQGLEAAAKDVAKTAAKEAAEEGSKDLALGLGDDLFTFAKENGFDTYRNFSSGFNEKKILEAMNNYDKIHFNTTGFGKVNFSRFKPNAPLTYKNYTNWEMHTIMNNPTLLKKATFYNKASDGSYQILNSYSPYFK